MYEYTANVSNIDNAPNMFFYVGWKTYVCLFSYYVHHLDENIKELNVMSVTKYMY